jgi:hypothetical protein
MPPYLDRDGLILHHILVANRLASPTSLPALATTRRS